MATDKDFNAVLYEKLYSKLAIALGVGTREGANMIGESLLSIYNPGQYLPVGLDPITSPEDDQEISQIFDTAPAFNFTYTPVNLRVTDAYRNILSYKLYPIADLTAAEKAKLETARKSYAALAPACDEAKYVYWDALDVLDEAKASYANGTGPKPTRRMEGDVQTALDNWVAAGKVQQETNLSIIRQLEGRDGSAFWDELNARFAANQRKLTSGLEFAPVTLAPKYKSWFTDAGWTKFSFDQKDMDNQSTSTSIGVAGALDGKFGIVTLSGSGSYQEDKEFIKIQETSLAFKCELMRVTINRNWMNPLVFQSRAWKFASDAPAAKYSTGGSIENRVLPTGPFVSLPTTVILARNVEIIGKFQDTVEERMKREIAAEASLGIGPFSISGSVSYKDRKESIKGTIANNLITIKDTQIIAAISQVLPEVPNPDNNLPWPT
jgi:hypothetical protein